MKIELKNIKVNLAFSEETTMFKADVFVNGKKVAFAENDGHGGCTHYNRYPDKDNSNLAILKQAEEFAKTLPSTICEIGSGKTFEINSTLENLIDTMINDFVNHKDKLKFEKKLNKAMETKIVWGKPNGDSFKSWGWKIPIKSVLLTPKGVDIARDLYNRVKLELKEGEVIFNTDLVELFDTVKS